MVTQLSAKRKALPSKRVGGSLEPRATSVGRTSRVRPVWVARAECDRVGRSSRERPHVPFSNLLLKRSLPPEALKQELDYFNLPSCFIEILPPGIDTVPQDKVAVL